MATLSEMFTIGQEIECEADRPPFLFVNRGSGTLRYRIVTRNGKPKLACFKESHGIPAEVKHCPVYEVMELNRKQVLCKDGIPLNLTAMRDDPIYNRRVVKVCMILDNKVIVE